MNSDPRLSLFRSIPAVLGEGAIWHESRQSLFWLDILGRKIFEASPENSETQTRDVEQLIGAIVPTARGDLLAMLQNGIYRLDLETGTATPVVCPAEHDSKLVRFNDAKCDPRGRLWAGTMALDESAGRGALYRITPEGNARRMREHVSISNGLAWSPDQRTLYYIDSPTRAVQAFDYEIETGELSRPRVAIDFSRQPGFPDGCTIDVDGNLWIAHWGGARVTRWDPMRAQLLDTVEVPVGQVTTCTFGGPQLDVLFITTAACQLSALEKGAQPEAGSVFAANVGTRGLPADIFAG